MRTDRRAFSVAELLITIGIFSILSILMITVLETVIRVWFKGSGRNDALNQILKARSAITRDLANSSQQNGQWAATQVAGHLGGYDGDALTFLSSDDGTQNTSWNANSVTGMCLPAAELTYYLVIPNAPNSNGITCSVGSPDAGGYEQQDPFKWLVRSVNPVTGTPPSVPTNWTTWLTQPSSLTATPTTQVVADQLLQFKVTSTPPTWTVQLTAVSVSDATRHLSVGRVALLGTSYAVTETFSIPANN